MAKDEKWLRAARIEKDLSQAEVAAKLGVSQSRISQWETGKAVPSPKNLASLRYGL